MLEDNQYDKQYRSVPFQPGSTIDGLPLEYLLPKNREEDRFSAH